MIDYSSGMYLGYLIIIVQFFIIILLYFWKIRGYLKKSLNKTNQNKNKPVAQKLTPLSTNLSLSACWQLNKHCYTRFGHLLIRRLPIGYRLIHVRRPYTNDI